MSTQFGTASAADVPQLVELLGILLAQEHELSPDPEKQRRALKLILADPSRARICVARDAAMVQLLLERNTDPNLQAPGGRSRARDGMARRNGDGASESLLLKAGARY